MLTLLALAVAFSPPPVFTPAEPAGTGTVRNFPDASMLTMEQEQVQSWLWDTLSVSRLDLSVAVGEGYQERLAAEIEAEDQEEGEGYAGEGEGTFGEEGELILGPIESYAGDGNEKARAAAVAEFLKAEGKDGSYEARMDEFLQAGEGEGFYSGEENEGTFEEEGESYDMGMSRRGREQLNSWKAYIKTMEEGEEGPSPPTPSPSPPCEESAPGGRLAVTVGHGEEKDFVKRANKAIFHQGIEIAASSSGEGRHYYSEALLDEEWLHTLVEQCAWLCGAEPRCAGFVDNREASPPYCVFKAAANNTRDEATKDVWEKTLACSPDDLISEM